MAAIVTESSTKSPPAEKELVFQSLYQYHCVFILFTFV